MFQKVTTTLSMALVMSAFGLSVLAAAQPQPASAQQKKELATSKDSVSERTKDSKVSYIYAAQPGDSYAVMARKAVQTYGKKFDVNLSQSRIIYAETHLTLQAGSPLLQEGQVVIFSEKTVGEWVEKAKNLSAAEAANWEPYAQGVNFNTDRVGRS